jgi:hemolysin
MTTEHAIVYAKAFSSVPSMLKMLGNKSSSYVKLEQGVSKISKNGIEVVAEDLTVVKVGSSNNKNTVTQTGKNSKEVVLYEDKKSEITVDVKDVFIADTGTTKSTNINQQVNKGTTSNNQKVDVTPKTTEGKNKTTNTSSYVTGIKEDKPNTFLNGKN